MAEKKPVLYLVCVMGHAAGRKNINPVAKCKGHILSQSGTSHQGAILDLGQTAATHTLTINYHGPALTIQVVGASINQHGPVLISMSIVCADQSAGRICSM